VDGKVNALDFNAVATNFGAAGGKIWSQGDFNYDGFVNTLDFNSLAANFNQSIAIPAAPALGTLVPEPASVALLAGLMCLTRRRARRHQL
jgi:hypothetical protein